ncbi:nucleoside hydrolase, putative [Trypanosoma brucei gambiense DAL972]|uniref:Nucleoside hydrolase, putative n=2 Tax=Trypanosoma brucei TaxID=5691 RepID=C9ZT72_TRYB9|nr:nucleoside hydrolase, putative [Trypanosoma brucei gambiense DAL972]RHW71676.1 nucleoside hydrolase [Trypanosoma brucei equiperdum]CBH12607.1 nucleoside hydrolase, putative [Trypanosoma brucei gambiense DAL972]|eukprot:XP_011774887.1 nucleoside hydrolase, putative [Trypanosoma brucei gambiense DAL972]
MVHRKLIIDTDCGGDDAIAIMLAMTQPDVEVIAITVVWGNVEVNQGMENIGKLLDLYDADIPFFRGAEGPLVGERETVQWGGFGSDGFGDAGFPPSQRVALQPKRHAALEILKILEEAEPSDDVVYQLVALGPLTNVALALRLNPDLFSKLGTDTIPGIVIMNGTSESKGNSNMAAEFNSHCDPEAGVVVLQHKGWKCPVQLVNWEVTVNSPMTWGFYDKLVNRESTPNGRVAVNQNKWQEFIEKLFQRLEAFTRIHDDGTRADTGDAEATQDVTCVVPDAVAVLVAIRPESVLDSFLTYVTVELHGRETRGATCIDWYGTEQSMAKKGRWRNCNVITKVDNEMFLKALRDIVEYVA